MKFVRGYDEYTHRRIMHIFEEWEAMEERTRLETRSALIWVIQTGAPVRRGVRPDKLVLEINFQPIWRIKGGS